jgi:hypothetical protein
MQKKHQSQHLVFAMALMAFALLFVALPLAAQEIDQNNPGILEPVTSALQNREVRVPNTDQSVDGQEQSTINGDMLLENAMETTSLLGHPITRVASPNDDMRFALLALLNASRDADAAAMNAAATDLKNILFGTTVGRIYDGFGMLNFNRFKEPGIGPEHFPPDAMPGEYKMKLARDTGETFISPFDGEQRRIWEADVALLYYDGQIDSDTFLLRFPIGHHADDVVRVNYRIYSLVREDFSPTLVMLDRRQAANSVNFPFKGFDSVWIAFDPGDVLNVTVNYPPVRMVRGVYTWGWRVHPPRIQFMQPVYEIENQNTGKIELDPQGVSFAFRNREELTLDSIGSAAPEMKMLKVAQAVLDGASPATIESWLTNSHQGPRGTWVDWSDLAKVQTQLPPEAWDALAEEGITPTNFEDFNMFTVYLNNEMYGEGPNESEVFGWSQGDVFKVKLVNLDNHTHYFRNVDFGTRLNDDILKCCGGGETSFEVMNFKPSYGAPKVAEMQWRAGWGFRPHYDVIQQDGVFPRSSDHMKVSPYTGGEGGVYYGYQYSAENRGGDFRFNPPNFIIGFDRENPSTFRLKDTDGQDGLLIGQFTEGYGVEQMCPDDPPGFCSNDIGPYNPNGNLNFDTDGDGVNDELRFPPFLRNPSQGVAGAGDIIPPTGAWRPFLWTNPNNGSLFLDPDDPSKGHWADLTYSHGAPVLSGTILSATIELPRASGQVFYQFDDLFHDNSIFSPHPLFEGSTENDEIVSVRAWLRGNTLRMLGQVSVLSTGEKANWVSLHLGAAGESGCAGTAVAFAEVHQTSGRFVLRKQDTSFALGAEVCVQSVLGGYTNVSAF